ncbi:MAG: hypothetical protein K2H24_06420 [Clostridia bacterium]|nr:hypothetical protein [Clostridia bacterium]MDE6605829.1 hypothetical protein [Clostridia bacterium]
MSAVNNLAKKLVLKRDLSPEGRITNYKGRIRQALAAISANLTKLVLLNLLMVVACAPLIATYFVMRSQEAAAVAGLNFSTGIGVGFGISDDTLLAIERIYDIRLMGYGLAIFPTCLLVGLFASGLYYCCRNMLWNTKVKVVKHFFRGIKNNWYKFMLSFAWLGALATGFACSLITVLKETALNGSANAGWWVLMIFIGILALLSALYMMVGQGMYVTYKFKMKEYIVNTCCLTLLMILPALIVTLFFSGVMALSFVSIIGMFLLVVMVMIGFSAFAMFNLAFSQYATDNFIAYLYEEEQKAILKEQEKQAKQRNKEKKKQAQKNNYQGKKKKR